MSESNLELCYMPATEAIKKFQEKTLSPVELVSEIIKRSEKVNATLNVFNYTCFEDALEKAKKAEKRYLDNSNELLPLEGIPLAIKDEAGIKGQPNTFGSLILKDNISEHTDADLEKLTNSGAVIHARSTCPEFSLTSFTHSRLNGVTHNPWNTKMTPGGSSGGSAAALASGATTLATGSDIGGSIRIPASACGIVGFKPPFGRNAQEPPYNLDQYCVVGPMARTVSDCALMQNVMCGPHPKDIVSIRPKINLPLNYPDIKGWKIAYSTDLGYFEVDKEVEQNTLQALEKFKSLGATVTEVKLNWKKEEIESACYSHYASFFAKTVADLLPEHKEKLSSYALMNAQSAEVHMKALLDNKKIYYPQLGANLGLSPNECAIVAGEMYSELSPILDQYDAFISPTNNLPAVKADVDLEKDPVIINGKEQVGRDMCWTMCYPFNMLGRLPVLSVPSGFASNGIPTGIQIISRSYADEVVFQAGFNYEKLDPWLQNSQNRPKI